MYWFVIAQGAITQYAAVQIAVPANIRHSGASHMFPHDAHRADEQPAMAFQVARSVSSNRPLSSPQ